MKSTFLRGVIEPAIIFISAFLLFLIQPMIAKFLLPSFGGAASVWTTSVLFFMVALFTGYTYVYALSRKAIRAQIKTHFFVAGIIIAITALQVLMRGGMFGETLTIDASIPQISTVLALLSLVGLPYLLLSTTGPLIQHWVALRDQQEPYKLYAVSNAGSLLGLICYPFLLEPLLKISAQGWVFFLSFLIYALLLFTFMRSLRSTEIQEEKHAASGITIKDASIWLALAALPSALLLSTTTAITSTIAPIPFLWVLPLALYLISMIIAFRGFGASGYFSLFLIFLSMVGMANLGWEYEAATRKILLFSSILFLTSLVAHYTLYERRPAKHASSLFYLILAGGGSLGALFVGMIAPLIFNDYYEFPLLLTAAGILGVLVFPAMRYIRESFSRSVRDWRVACAGVMIALCYVSFTKETYPALDTERNFYGVTKVYEDETERSLMHGTTMHGNQLLDPILAHEPSSYYTRTSGIGRAFGYHQKTLKKPSLQVGMVGLGTGSIASYCRAQDSIVFYEIDPRVESVAREFFTYLDYCKNSAVRIGDGRLVLQNELDTGTSTRYDILAIDAFSDDTIPTHLLTVEALRLYRAFMKDDASLIVIHTSNRYMRLVPAVLASVREAGLYGRVVNDAGEGEHSASSEWVVIATNESVFNAPEFREFAVPEEAFVVAWTDDYTNVLETIDLPALTPGASE